jgi:NLR family CARD domain-containing protein 3
VSTAAAADRYTTTLHVINSAVVKLGKLQRAEKVYRGMAGGVLPEQFWTASQHNVRGGCEYGFLSTTRQGDVAFEYAAQRNGGAGIVFEIQVVEVCAG